jgi:hypothetical protein
MPTGPKGQKRPAEVISAAVKVMRIATGQETETDPAAGKNPTAVALGKLSGAKGGKARAASMTAEQRKEAARFKPGGRRNQDTTRSMRGPAGGGCIDMTFRS